MSQLIFAIRSASFRIWFQTLQWLGYNLLGSLMPIWGTYFLLRLHHQQFYLNDFVKHGEFALYTAAFLTPALQLVVTNIRNAKYVLGTGTVLFALAGLVVAVNIYSGVAVGLPSPQQIDEHFLFLVSVILFLSSLAFAFLVTLIEYQVANPNPRKSEAEDSRELNERFSEKQPEVVNSIDEPAPPDDLEIVPEGELASKFKTDEPEQRTDLGAPND
jgi:hypothetical protein